MTSEPTSGDPAAASDREPLTRKQKALLYVNSRRRRFWAGFAFIAIWILLTVLFDRSDSFGLGLIPNLFLYGGGFLLAILWTHGAVLNQPARLPAGFMRSTAAARFMDEETWETDLSPTQAQEALLQLFQQRGAEARAIGTTVWVQLGKEWHAEEWCHRGAAPHMKRKAPVHFFVGTSNAGSAITAFSRDRRLFGMNDVVRLSDEMSATAVNLARQVTETRPRDGEGREQ